MVICPERGADLHMVQLMPLPLTVSCLSKIQISFTFWYRLTWVVLDKGPLVCVCLLPNEFCNDCVVAFAILHNDPLTTDCILCRA